MSTFDDNFPAKGNPKMSDRVFGFDSESLKNAGMTNQALYDLFKGNLANSGEFPTAASLLPAFDLSNARVMTPIGPDDKEVKSNVLDNITGEYTTFKEYTGATPLIDGVMFLQHNGKYFKRVSPNGVSVKWFGAKGDGTTDDTIAFNKAVTFAKNYNWSVTLVLPEGNYKLTSSILLDYDKCRIRGEGLGISVIHYYYEQINTSATYSLEKVNSCFVTPDSFISNLELRDFSIEYKGTYHIPDPTEYYSHGRGAISGLLIRKVNGASFLNMEVKGFNDCGVRFDTVDMPADYGDSLRVNITNCFFHSNHFSNIHARNVDGLTISDSDFNDAAIGLADNLVGTTGYGVSFSNYNGNFAKNIIIKGNRFRNNSRKGLDSHGCGNITVSGNTFSRNRATQCAMIYNSGSLVIQGNIFEDHIELPKFSGKPNYRFVSLDLGKPSTIAENGIARYNMSINGNIFRDIDINDGNKFTIIGCNTDVLNLNLDFSGNIIDAKNTDRILQLTSQETVVGNNNTLSMGNNIINVQERCSITAFELSGFEHYIFGNNKMNVGSQGVSLNGDTVVGRNPFLFLDINTSGAIKTITYTDNYLKGNKWDNVSFANPANAVYVPVDAFATLSGVNRNTKVIAESNWLNNSKDTLSDLRDYADASGLTGNGYAFWNAEGGVSFLLGGSSTYLTGNGTVTPFGPAVRASQLVGTAPLNEKINTSDTVLTGFNKAQGQIDGLTSKVIRQDVLIDTVNSTFSASDIDKYVRFTGTTGNSNIVLNRFSATNELMGEVEGGQRTITGDSGVTIRVPSGMTATIKTNGRFRIKFKTANNVLLTGDLVPAA